MRKFDLDFTWFPQKYDSRVANFNFIIEQKLEKTIYSKRGKEYAIYICTLPDGTGSNRTGFQFCPRHHYETLRGTEATGDSEQLQTTGCHFEKLRNEKKIFLFLLAFFFYIDGVYTIIDMATAYGTALGFDSTKLLLALLVTQIVAFPFAIIFGRLANCYKTERLIMICIGAYLGIAIFAIFLREQWQFWILAILVGMFQGGIQALSRSYFAKIIPPEKSGEYFGLMDICGKGASFLGTTVIGLISQVTGKVNIGVGAISVFFILGMIVFRMATAEEKGEGKKVKMRFGEDGVS